MCIGVSEGDGAQAAGFRGENIDRIVAPFPTRHREGFAVGVYPTRGKFLLQDAQGPLVRGRTGQSSPRFVTDALENSIAIVPCIGGTEDGGPYRIAGVDCIE
jgi:hypothetical protein